MDTVIAMDGPAGAGKSTLAKLVAKKVGASYINTGSLYRALAWSVISCGQDFSKIDESFIKKQKLEFRGEDLFLNGILTGQELRSAECADLASKISALPFVRNYLLDVQRHSAARQWIVMEGRDIGTVIFPEAAYKFFVTASVEVRAARRLAQSNEVDDGATLQSVMNEISGRDERDRNREIAPLRQASDAILVDTSNMNIEQAVDFVVGKISLPLGL